MTKMATTDMTVSRLIKNSGIEGKESCSRVNETGDDGFGSLKECGAAHGKVHRLPHWSAPRYRWHKRAFTFGIQ